MRQLNSLPGLQARAILKPGAQYGSSDTMVRVEEDPFSASTAPDNYVRENICEFRLSAQASLNSPYAVGEQLNIIGLVRSEEHPPDLQSLMRTSYASLCCH